jgi:hypothetical protein
MGGKIGYRVMTSRLTFARSFWATALILCACQYVADLRESDVSVRDDGADAADLDADAADRDAEADAPRDPDGEGDPDASDPDAPDDADVPADDGAEAGCTENAQCDDLEDCNGTETCNTATGTCVAGTNRPAGYRCDDGNPCTVTSTCDGAGGCANPSGNICDDHLDCTADDCTMLDSSTYECRNPLTSGFCLIADQCFYDGAQNPSNQCQACYATTGPYGWTDRADRTSCTSGICCSGICRTGGNCCRDDDCSSGCHGTPVSCSSLTTESACDGQMGCTWEAVADPPVCTGTADACLDLSMEECLDQQGCDLLIGMCIDYSCM